LSEALPDFICPLVLDLIRDRQPQRHFRSRYRSLTFKPALRSPLEQLAEVNKAPRELGPEYVLTQTIMFDITTIVVARSASVLDWTDPKKRLPGNGLKLFRARVETGYGDQIDVSGYKRHPAGPVAECFWGTGSRPAVITGGLTFDTGSSMAVHYCPRILDIEVELGFWTIEEHGFR
jgi:hypothetical protein